MTEVHLKSLVEWALHIEFLDVNTVESSAVHMYLYSWRVHSIFFSDSQQEIWVHLGTIVAHTHADIQNTVILLCGSFLLLVITSKVSADSFPGSQMQQDMGQ